VRFSAIFGDKNGVLLKNQCNDQIFTYFSFNLSQKRQFFRQFFGENILKIKHNIGLGYRIRAIFCSFLLLCIHKLRIIKNQFRTVLEISFYIHYNFLIKTERRLQFCRNNKLVNYNLFWWTRYLELTRVCKYGLYVCTYVHRRCRSYVCTGHRSSSHFLCNRVSQNRESAKKAFFKFPAEIVPVRREGVSEL
jgi:hypothetical protein